MAAFLPHVRFAACQHEFASCNDRLGETSDPKLEWISVFLLLAGVLQKAVSSQVQLAQRPPGRPPQIPSKINEKWVKPLKQGIIQFTPLRAVGNGGKLRKVLL